MHAVLSLPLCLLPLLGAPGASDPAGEADEAARAHYLAVEAELLAREPEGLSETQRRNRARAIAALARYRERGEFGRNTHLPYERVPLFVDPQGRRCAVAELLHVFGRDDLVRRVADTNNLAYVADLRGDAELAAWLEGVGLTLAEAARIQVPGSRPGSDTGGGGPGSSGSPRPDLAGAGPGRASPRGSGGAVPNVPAVPRPTPAGAAPSPSAPGGSVPTTLPTAAEDWWDWWEFNKLEWLVPGRIRQATGEEGRTWSGPQLAALRRRVDPLLRAGMEHEVAAVRGAAVIAHARSAETVDLEGVLALLDDPQPRVRRHAILALGASGSSRALHALLQIAWKGSTEGGREEIATHARPTAVLALGLARAAGVGGSGAGLLPRAPADGSAEGEDLTAALLMNHTLAPSPELTALPRGLSGVLERRAPRGGVSADREGRTRARALDVLRFDDPGEVLSGTLRSLGSRYVQERRAAAQVLGELEGEHALPPLMTAYELEREPLTRAFLLLAIGRRGGDEAREFLVRNLEHGPRATRPWTAFALGTLAHEAGDGAAREALLEGLERERTRGTRGALLLALGIAGDERAGQIARATLESSGSAVARMHAGLALALTGDAEAGPALRAAIADDPSPMARFAYAQGLARLGDPGDVPVLVDLLREVSDPDGQAQLAVAIAFHGSAEAVHALAELVAEGELSASGHASALQALGMLLSRKRPFALAALTERMNHDLIPAWLMEPLVTTL